MRKFVDSADKKRIFPSKEGITLDPQNFDFLFSIINAKYKNNLTAVKDNITKDYERLVKVREDSKKKRKLDDCGDNDDNDN